MLKLRKARPEGVAWCGLNGLPLRMLELTGIVRLFPHYDSAGEAIAALGG